MAETIEKNVKNLMRRPGVLPTGVLGGKLPPQAVDVECIVLGALMLEKDAINDVMGVLSTDCWYKSEHQEIYSAIIKLHEGSQPIDIITVTNMLRQMGRLDLAGGAFYISELTNAVSSSANIEYHARIIYEKYLLREVITTSSANVTEAYEETTDCFELVDRAQKRAFDLTDGIGSNNQVNLATAMQTVVDIPQGTKPGIPSGWKNLDRLIPGFLPGENIVIAARPGMGKTAFVLQLSKQLSEHFPVAFFSLEMQAAELAKRMLAAESGVPLDAILRNNCTEPQRLLLKNAIEKLRSRQIIIDDGASQRPLQILSKLRKLKRQQGIGAVVIDYIQLVDPYDSGRKFNNTEAEVSYVSKSMKRMAKDLDVPVIVLSQLNRNVEGRGGEKRPMLSDLRDSGSIEQDADKVIFLYRPEYYGLTTGEKGEDLRGICEVIIAKQRNGALDTAILTFDGKHQTFTDR